MMHTEEHRRLEEHYRGGKNWLKWGPYLSERQWGTVREDYSPDGDAWNYFPHDHARSRAYRWGEDGLMGISDTRQHTCFALALWNGQDSILKERLFGLTGPEGNHAEDVKELYYYLDNTPSHSYMKQLYKYPQAPYPYEELIAENAKLDRYAPEYELLDTGLFDENRYFDVFAEYAKGGEEDILIRIKIFNRGPEAAPIWLLPTLWFRNTWSFGLTEKRPRMKRVGEKVLMDHPETGRYHLYFEEAVQLLFTENETNKKRLFGKENESPFVKDSFHKAIIEQEDEVYAKAEEGSKCAPVYHRQLESGEGWELRLRLSTEEMKQEEALGEAFEQVFVRRIREADDFYAQFKGSQQEDLANIQRQAFAGMLWTKQYYYIDIPQWLEGDPGKIAPPESRKKGRNSDWKTLNNDDIISMPDKWEYPWYAAWDLAFHCVPLAMLDPDFAKEQLILFLREWYMHPNGQMPAYEWSFGDVNPPVHAWACLQVYKLEEKKTGKGDKLFLERVFQKLLINFTWWVNRKDRNDNNVFEGGFLGLDNIGVFDRSSEIPGGGHLEQADGTAWMGLYSLNMLEIALVLADDNVAYEDVATKFFEHFIYIASSLNDISEGWTGAWDEKEGFFYDILSLPGGKYVPLKVRSLVGLTSMFAVFDLDKKLLEKVPDFRTRFNWFINYQSKVDENCLVIEEIKGREEILLSLVPRERLERLVQTILDEREFFSPAGIRSLSKIHEIPYEIIIEGQSFGLSYQPAESTTSLFGGNSNWRGPVWFSMNYLLILALRELSLHYKEDMKVECPTGSGRFVDLKTAADDIAQRLIGIFTKDMNGKRRVHGEESRYQHDPHFKDLILFYEYFHGDNGRGVGASHQTGWTGLVATLIEELF